MSERSVLALTGYAGTGKTTISEYLKNKYGFVVVEGSALIRQIASEAGETLSLRRDYEEAFRTIQRVRGRAWIAETLLGLDDERLLQVGLRAEADLLRLKEIGGLVIALTCLPEVCLKRMNQNNPKSPHSLEEYAEHLINDDSPDEFGYGSHTSWCVAKADYHLDTSSESVEETFAEIDSLLAQ